MHQGLINQLWDKISLYVSKRNIITGIILIIVFNLVLLPGFPKLFLPGNAQMFYPLDLKFGYTPKEAFDILNKLGNKGRNVYMMSEMLIDCPYAVAYSFVYALVIAALFKKPNSNKLKYLILFPFFIGLFDMLENSFIILSVIFFTGKYDPLIYIASGFTILKWSFAFITFLIVLAGLINLLFIPQGKT